MTALRTMLFGLLAAVVPFAFGWWAGRHFADVDRMPAAVRIDTVYFERPTEVAASARTVTVNVPRLLFAGERVKKADDSFTYPRPYAKDSAVVADYATAADGEVQCANIAQCPDSGSEVPNTSGNFPEIPEGSADSLRLELPIETRIYEDSLYRARVSGPALGGYRPALDWVQVYDHTTVYAATRCNRFALTAGVGAAYTPRGFQPTIGVQVGVVLWGW